MNLRFDLTWETKVCVTLRKQGKVLVRNHPEHNYSYDFSSRKVNASGGCFDESNLLGAAEVSFHF